MNSAANNGTEWFETENGALSPEHVRAAGEALAGCESVTKLLLALSKHALRHADDEEGSALLRQMARQFAEHEAMQL
jgi:hypothetical protein